MRPVSKCGLECSAAVVQRPHSALLIVRPLERIVRLRIKPSIRGGLADSIRPELPKGCKGCNFRTVKVRHSICSLRLANPSTLLEPIMNRADISAETPPTAWLTHKWVVAGMVSASARFIPVPFVDDIVRERCRQFVVSRTLEAEQSPTSIRDLEPYYADRRGYLGGCLRMLIKVPLKLLFFPIRKFLALITSVHGVPLEITRTVLLGRTLQRHLRQQPKIDISEALRMREAFDLAFARMDFRALRAALSDAYRSVQGGKAAGIEMARKVATDRAAADGEIEVDDSVQQSASRLEQVFSMPETARLFEEFDRRFDDAFGQPASG